MAQATHDHVATDSTGACSCGSDHDHGPTGADIVQSLGRGFAIASIATPAIALVLLALALLRTPSTPLILLLGLGLGLAQIAVLLGLSGLATRTRALDPNGPMFLGARAALDEVLRLLVVLLGLVLFPYDLRGPLGLWIGVGAMLVWAALSTTQLAGARRRILKPGDWSKATVLGVLDQKISVPRAMTMRLVDITAVLLFQISATVLVAAAPVMAAAMVVLAVASGLSTLVLQRHAPSTRQTSPWVYAPIAVSILTTALALTLVLIPGL